MPKCYLCGAELTAENESEEHIIINAIWRAIIVKLSNSYNGSDFMDLYVYDVKKNQN